mmetsp:Transcript_14280/g.16446  ORF Transcript_14280/g.16446 Transcript_14280/m.16446 type:complete len:80 (+) Transcript_14280:94-333(+)
MDRKHHVRYGLLFRGALQALHSCMCKQAIPCRYFRPLSCHALSKELLHSVEAFSGESMLVSSSSVMTIRVLYSPSTGSL